MEIALEDFQSADESTGPVDHRPNGNELPRKTPSLLVPSSGPNNCGMQRSSLELEPMAANISVPTEVAHTDRNDQASNLPEPRSHHSPVVSSGDMVPLHLEQITLPVAPAPTGSNKKWTARLREVDRLQFLKEVFASSLGETVASRLISAHRESTSRQAQSVLKAFKEWLPKDKLCITS